MPFSQFPQWYHLVNRSTSHQDTNTDSSQATEVYITPAVIPAAPL